ncbi:MAG TPA: alpha/beta hydrolase [Steroidobacteraceae bacterium]|jgi:pimeloyl-ACP methyl ester carboxylesterase|nr:alpha/beta hydrolase [Steroidobacteraceae bacterium]
MRADKWLEINLLGLVILAGLAFVAARLMDMHTTLSEVQADQANTTRRVDQIAAALPNATTQDEKRLEKWLGQAAHRTAQVYGIEGANSVDEAGYVPVDGMEQWLSIQGEDRTHPVLLFVHGGPGDASSAWAYPYFRSWEHDFVVAQWDQRGAGRTLTRSGAPSALSLDRMVEDGVQVAEYLHQRLKQPKIVLVGQDWGSVLGLLMIKARPDLFLAYVGTGQIVDPVQDERASYALALKSAQDAHDAQAVADLKAAGLPPYAEGSPAQQILARWRDACEGAQSDRFRDARLGFALAAPGYSVHDLDDWLDGRSLSAQLLARQQREFAPRRLQGSFEVPLFVIQGAGDCTSPAPLAMHWLQAVQAPRKQFLTIEDAGHFAMFVHSDAFLHAMSGVLAPLLYAPHTPASAPQSH